MKKVMQNLALLLILGTNALTAMETTPCELPHLMLFMDINKTIIAEDKAKNLGPEASIAAHLSSEPEYAYTWGDGSQKMTFEKWVNEKLFPGTDPALKKIRDAYHPRFIDAAREQNHPMSKEINEEFETLVNPLKAREPRKVFTSFSNLITYLRDKNYSFSIILRTFGQDLVWVSEELAQDGLTFVPGSFKKSVLYLDNKVLTNPKDMIAAFKPGTHYAIQDSYDWWKEYNFAEKGGKPFPIDISNKKILSMFFDDNADDPARSILHIMPIGKKTDLHELIKMGRVVPVDTREAIKDNNYFIKTVKNALEQWKAIHCQ